MEEEAFYKSKRTRLRHEGEEQAVLTVAPPPLNLPQYKVEDEIPQEGQELVVVLDSNNDVHSSFSIV